MRHPSRRTFGRGARGAVGAILLLAALDGCASVGVAPWERDVLARRSMQLNPSPQVLAADEHTYYAKEGSSGGRSFDGGGCGCN